VSCLVLYFKCGQYNISTTFNREYQAAEADDLFSALQTQADEDGIFSEDPDLNVTVILKSWTTQSGYPYITANRMESGIHITQVS
jgi:aminopeptidase N